MKTPVIALSLVLCCPLLANGQSVALITTETNELPDGRVQLIIHNNSRVPLTAWNVTDLHTDKAGHPKVKGDGIWDAVTETPLRTAPVLPGQVETLTFGSEGEEAPTVVILEAAVLADGTLFGNQAAAQRIVERRRYMLQVYEESLSILQEASSKHTPREQIVERFKAVQDEHKKAAPDHEREQWALAIAGTVIANLTLGQRGDPTAMRPLDQTLAHVIDQFLMKEDALVKSLPNLKDK